MTRQITTRKNSKCIQNFFEKKSNEGYYAGIFFKNNILYSYGIHHPLVIRLTKDGKDFYLVNNFHVSFTTARQRGAALKYLESNKLNYYGILNIPAINGESIDSAYVQQLGLLVAREINVLKGQLVLAKTQEREDFYSHKIAQAGKFLAFISKLLPTEFDNTP